MRSRSELQTSSDLDLRLYIPGGHLNAMIYTILVTSFPYTKVSFTVLILNAAIPIHSNGEKASVGLVAGRV